MTIQLSVENWVSLPQETREKLREIFNIKRSANACVVDNRLVCDGSSYDDLAVVTVKAMQDYLGSKEKDFQALILNTIEKATVIEAEPVVGAIEPIVEPVIEPIKIKKVKKTK